MLSCRDLTENATSYLEQEMPVWRRMQFRLHLAMCVHCRAYVEQIELTIRTLGSLPETSVADEVKEALVRQFRDAKSGE